LIIERQRERERERERDWGSCGEMKEGGVGGEEGERKDARPRVGKG